MVREAGVVSADYPKAPPRGPLPPSIEQAARTIHREVWGESYKPGEGPKP